MSIITFLNDKHIHLHTFGNRNIVTVAGVGCGSGSVAGLGRGWMSSEGWTGTGADTGGLRSLSCEGRCTVDEHPVQIYIYIFAFRDAFIQSDLQCIQVLHFFCQYVCSLGIEPTTFALLTQCSTTEQQEHSLSKYSLSNS